jgi:hypothetical protein
MHIDANGNTDSTAIVTMLYSIPQQNDISTHACTTYCCTPLLLTYTYHATAATLLHTVQQSKPTATLLRACCKDACRQAVCKHIIRHNIVYTVACNDHRCWLLRCRLSLSSLASTTSYVLQTLSKSLQSTGRHPCIQKGRLHNNAPPQVHHTRKGATYTAITPAVMVVLQ